MSADATTVAGWMLEKLESSGSIYQEDVVYEIKDLFGSEFTYENENGNLAIEQKVLAEFRKLTENTVVWERDERVWRWRQDYDSAGRQTD